MKRSILLIPILFSILLTGCLTKVTVEPVVIQLPTPPIKPGISFSKAIIDGNTVYYLNLEGFKSLGKYFIDLEAYQEKLETLLSGYYIPNHVAD